MAHLNLTYQRRTPAVAVILIIGIALGLAVGLPYLSSKLPQVYRLEHDQVQPLTLSQLTAPAGWQVEIGSATSGQPQLSKDGVSVSARDGLWFGASDRMVRRLVEVFVPAEVRAEIPELPRGTYGKEREQFEVPLVLPDGENALAVVVRQGFLAVLLVVRGVDNTTPPAEVTQIIDSVEFVDLGLNELP